MYILILNFKSTSRGVEDKRNAICCKIRYHKALQNKLNENLFNH